MNIPDNNKVWYSCSPINDAILSGFLKNFQMTLIFNERGLKDVSPPCVAQTFVPHGAVLFKLYVLGNQFSVVERPSLKNFKACGKSL